MLLGRLVSSFGRKDDHNFVLYVVEDYIAGSLGLLLRSYSQRSALDLEARIHPRSLIHPSLLLSSPFYVLLLQHPEASGHMSNIVCGQLVSMPGCRTDACPARFRSVPGNLRDFSPFRECSPPSDVK